MIWLIALPIILGLCGLVFYLQRSRNQLKIATERQVQLSGMLINAQEKERSRLASELHDDFSQRLALLALGLETAAEIIAVSPQEAQQQLHELLNSASELGADLHTLSHRLHSSTLESLGLVAAVTLKKHSGATEGLVDLGVSSNRLTLAIEDRGRGFDLAELHAKEGLGIRSMEERARVLGGEFKIQSAPGRGTTMNVWVPLMRGEAGEAQPFRKIDRG